MSVKPAGSEFALSVVVRSNPSEFSMFRLSSLHTSLSLFGDGEVSSLVDAGETSSDDGCLKLAFDEVRLSFNAALPLLSFRDGRLCLRLKFFNQVALLAGFDAACSGPETEEKYSALSLMASSESKVPFFCSLMTQFDSVFSMSGDLPFNRLSGERTASVCFSRYFSFCRSTLETVLRSSVWKCNHEVLSIVSYLLSTPNIAILNQPERSQKHNYTYYRSRFA